MLTLMQNNGQTYRIMCEKTFTKDDRCWWNFDRFFIFWPFSIRNNYLKWRKEENPKNKHLFFSRDFRNITCFSKEFGCLGEGLGVWINKSILLVEGYLFYTKQRKHSIYISQRLSAILGLVFQQDIWHNYIVVKIFPAFLCRGWETVVFRKF